MKIKHKNIFKSLLALTLAFIMLLGAAPLSALVGIDFASLFAPKAEAAEAACKVGDIIEFGSYPQSRVTDSATVSTLDKISKNWVSYGYYSGDESYGYRYDSMVRGDWMRYADITYNGAKYRAVFFTQYRPYDTLSTSSSDRTYQDDNGYTPYNTYYFKYEPLKWRVLDPATGLVLCENTIDSQAYSNTLYFDGHDFYGSNDVENAHYACDYATSSIRKWLNYNFYNTAFSVSQQANILTSKLDNKAYFEVDSHFDGEDTYDKIYILSYSEMQNTAYGFTSPSSIRAKGTEYAKCQGLWVDSSNEYSSQLLRNVIYSEDHVWSINGSGNPSRYGSRVIDTTNGIRPALRIYNLTAVIAASTAAASERNAFIANMPKLEPSDAKQFLSFIYKTDFTKTDITNDIQYKLLTGDLYDTNLSVDEIKAYILAFCTLTERTVNSYVDQSTAIQNFTCSKLIERLQKELKGMKTPEQEFVLSYAGKLKDMVEDAFVGIMAGAVSKYTGIYITEQVLDNASGIIATIDSVDAVPGKIEKFYNKVYAGVDAIFFIISQELIGRYGFFNSYVSNRSWADSADDPAFRVLVDWNFIAYADSTLFSEAINLTTWITGKESWNRHRDDIERWAEFFWQLDSYQNAEVHNWCEEKYSPSCTKQGFTRHVCATCGEEYTDSYVAAKGHNYQKTVVAPTCTSSGYTYCVCKNCGDTYLENETPAKNHSYKVIKTVESNCEEAGYTLYKCSCGEQYYEYTAAAGHKYSQTAVVEPTEKTQGYTQYNCSVCGRTKYDDFKNPLSHSFVVETVAPGCETAGYTKHTCSTCGETYTDSEVAALGHSYKCEIKVQSSCEEKGKAIYTCTRCGDSYEEEISETGHNYVVEHEQEATCTESGYIEYICQCGSRKKEETASAAGHDYVKISETEGSCTKNVTTTYECSHCGDKYDTVTKAPGHIFGDEYDETVEGDCTHAGYKKKNCTVCGHEEYFDIVAPDGHKFSDWTVTKPATAESEGLRERTCTVCGEKETGAIPKLDFIYGDVNGDGKINGRDAIKLAKYLAAYDEDKGESSVAVSPGADVNGDGKINGRDLVKLRKYLANYDESTGKSTIVLGPME